jgi:dihydrophenazinedicarboxylate synthase
MNASMFESLSGETDLDFPEYEAPPPEPMGLVRQWLAAAIERGVTEPRSCSLATVDTSGRISSRIVALTAINSRGLVFTSHSSSRKGRDLAATGMASALLYWRETSQQVDLSGPVVCLSPAESDTLWNDRPFQLHAMSVASRQSDPLDDPAALRADADRLSATGGPLPRPTRFVGYRLEPDAVEFWCASSDRLHRRLRYERCGQAWNPHRLQP